MIKELSVIILISSGSVFAHGNEDHKEEVESQNTLKVLKEVKNSKSLEKINEQYTLNIKPIFAKSCLPCHGQVKQFPWYYKIPGIKQLIDYDTKEAKMHLDFTKDYPFKSHDTPENDLSAISKSIKSGSMPPLRYRVMHSDSKLNEEEIKEIENWIRITRKLIK